MADQIQINELSFAAINGNSIYFDFGRGYGDMWEEIFPCVLQCDYCQATYIDEVYTEGDRCPDQGCHELDTGTLERPDCAPQMNYYYPLPHYEGYPEIDQANLLTSSANVVLVKIIGVDDDEDVYALALSGGGMDLSWDICHAYILLGYAPPLHFCDLPEFAGQDNSREPFWSILKACLMSVKAAEQRAQRQKGQLIQMALAALNCPECGHPDRHNRMGGCEYGVPTGRCWGCDNNSADSSQHGHPQRCVCLFYPEGRPADAEAIRSMA